jgi:hypothetical protein
VVAVKVTGRKTGRVRLTKTPDAMSNSLNKFFESNIEMASTIIKV